MRKLKMRKAVAVIISVFLLILAMPLSGEWDKAFAAASDYEINETYRDCNITFNNCHIFLWTILLYCYYAEIFGISD